jgi:hypothetical protein
MESPISKIEAIIPMLATREDLAKHEGITRQVIMRLEMTMQAGFERQEKNFQAALLSTQLLLQKDINSQTWKFLVWATSLVGMVFSASYFIVTRIS